MSAQPIDFDCVILEDTTSGDGFAPKSLECSENGWHIPTQGVYKILIIYAEVAYTSSNDFLDPDPSGSTNWPINDIPTWADDLVDQTSLTNPQGYLSKYFREASSGNLEVIGDYLEGPSNNGVFTVNYSGTLANPDLTGPLATVINTAMGTSFLSSSGQTNASYFDNFSDSQEYQVKTTPSTDSPSSIDHVMVVWRNHPKYNGGNAMASGGSFGNITGHPSDTWCQLGAKNGVMPTFIPRHELGHLVLGNNSYHCAGGGNQVENYWIPATGGHSMMGSFGSALLSWNGWDRYRLGWDASGNSHLISARNSTGTTEVSGDLDASNPSDAGTYVLRDFVETGDAIRIKLPFIDSDNEFEQWLWLENHRTKAYNANEFDQFTFQPSTTCVDDADWGLTISMQIDREEKCGDPLPTGYIDYYRQLSADGMWERDFEPPILDQCTGWSDVNRSSRLLPNPLTGYGDVDGYPLKLDASPNMSQNEQKAVNADFVAGNYEYKLFSNGNPRQFFKSSGNDKMTISTNPSSAAQMNLVGRDAPVATKNLRKIYLNGVSIKILEMQPNGYIKVEIKFDEVNIQNDVRWCAPEIVLNPISSPSGYSLNVESGHTLTLDHGTAATRMNSPITFEGEDVYTSPTVMQIKSGATLNLESGSELIVDRRSTLALESGSKIQVENGATLRIRNEGALNIEDGAELDVSDGGEIIIEGATSDYDRGVLRFFENARINLNGSTSILDVSGQIDIQDDADFHLSSSGSTTKTNGKIIFRSTTDVEATAGINSSFSLEGFSQSQEVLINEKAILEFPSVLSEFNLTDLRVSQSFNRRIEPPKSNSCSINFDNVLFTNDLNSFGYTHKGVWFYGQQLVNISNCVFQFGKNGIYAQNTLLGNGIQLENTEFNQCDAALYTYDEGAIMDDVSFRDCVSPWLAENTSMTSLLNNVSTSGTIAKDFIYGGASTLDIENSDITDGTVGIVLDQANLILRCSSVQSHAVGFDLSNGSSISSMSYSTCTGNSQTINMNSVNLLQLNNGYNKLSASSSATPNVIVGSMLCPPATIYANRNNWNAAGTAPTSSDYDITSICSPSTPITISDASPLPIGGLYACPDPGTPGPGLGIMANNGNEIKDGNSSQLAKSDDELLDFELIEIAFNEAMEKLNGADLGSILIGNSETADGEVLEPNPSAYLAMELNGFNEMHDLLVLDNAREALGDENFHVGYNAIFSSFIELHTGAAGIEEITEETLTSAQNLIIDVQDVLETGFIESSEISRQYYLTLDRAQVHRVTGNYASSLSILDDAWIIATTEEDQAFVDKLYCMVSAEFQLHQDQDTEAFIEAISLCKGVENPSIFIEENQLLEQDQELIQLDAFPNPTDNEVQLLIDGQQIETQNVEVFDLYGRKVRATGYNTNGAVNLTGLPQGIYLLRVHLPNGTFAKSKIIKN
ncbi:MAG: T9SS type A sorting domain-containing protein [Flavobacteriales bacterium]|nr:T9SS type A sorting domain-containing protein [Flavobacteriales bacterium]